MRPQLFYQICKRKGCKMVLNFIASSFVFWHINRENLSRNVSVNVEGGDFRNASEFHGKQFNFWTHKSWNCTQNFFFKTCRQRTSRMRLNFTVNSFIFGRIDRENGPITFFIKLERRKLPKCVWTWQQTASFLDTKIVELRPQIFLQTLQAENFRNASELHGKQLRFGHKNREIVPKTCKRRTSKMRLSYTSNSLDFGRTNREIAPRTFL